MTTRPIITNPLLLENLKNQIFPKAQREEIGNLANKVFNLDACDYLSLFPDNSVDFVATDEFYGQGYANTFFYNMGNGKAAKNPIVRNFGWDNDMPAHLVIPWVYEAYRILKPGGALLNCGLASWSTSFEDVVHDAGLTFRAHIPWIKTNPMRQIHPGSWRSAHEFIWIASKGTLADRMRGKVTQYLRVNWHIETVCPECGHRHNVIDESNYRLLYRGFSELGGLLEPGEVPSEEWLEENLDLLVETYLMTEGNLPVHLEPKRAGTQKCHDTQKPAWLGKFYTDLLTNAGDLVVDPFAGSGELLTYCPPSGRFWGANDKDLVNVKNIKIRLGSTERSLFNEPHLSLLPGDDYKADEEKGVSEL